jgi:hypothetical protein
VAAGRPRVCIVGKVANTITPQRSAEEIRNAIEGAQEVLKTNPNDYAGLFTLIVNQYFESWAVRGDNTPEAAAYLGYLDFKTLYPDVQGKTFESIFKEVLEGKPGGYKNPAGYNIDIPALKSGQ